MKKLVLLLTLLILSTCKDKIEKNNLIHFYGNDDSKFLKAKEMLKLDRPNYFKIIKEENVVGLVVYTEKYECVSIMHTTDILFENTPSLYCFDFYSGEFKTKI